MCTDDAPAGQAFTNSMEIEIGSISRLHPSSNSSSAHRKSSAFLEKSGDDGMEGFCGLGKVYSILTHTTRVFQRVRVRTRCSVRPVRVFGSITDNRAGR